MSNRIVTRKFAKENNIDINLDPSGENPDSSTEKQKNPYRPSGRRSLKDTSISLNYSNFVQNNNLHSTNQLTNESIEENPIENNSESGHHSNIENSTESFEKLPSNSEENKEVNTHDNQTNDSAQHSEVNSTNEHPHNALLNDERILNNNNNHNNNNINQINNEQPVAMALSANQSISLRDALEFVPEYDGENMTLTEFITACNEAFNSLPEDAELNLVKLLRKKLKGDLRKSINCATVNTKQEFYDFLRGKAAPNKTEMQLLGELGRVYQKDRESVLKYSNRICDIAAQLVEVHKKTHTQVENDAYILQVERRAVESFLNGLNPEIESKIRTLNNNFQNTLNEAIKIEQKIKFRKELSEFENIKRRGIEKPVFLCDEVNREHNNSQKPHQSNYQQKQDFYSQNKQFDNNKNFNQQSNLRQTVICQFCDKAGHTADKCFKLLNSRESQNVERCQICNRSGHIAKICRFKHEFLNNNSKNFNKCLTCGSHEHSSNNCPKQIISCDYCKKIGHKIRDCWKKINDEEKQIRENHPSTSNSHFGYSVNPNVGRISVMIDTGSGPNILKESFCPKGAILDKTKTIKLLGINEIPVEALGEVELDFLDLEIKFLIVPDDFPIEQSGILGSNFFDEAKVQICYKDRIKFIL
ncbi:GATA zinc finger domain-containing protein 14-like [Microplitis mediator]|uniref:GATA zinc finger domain-containing protein 14-like n=1 Tax=Microplitis mediator TaxID=375433 RepID=UPI002552F765|nr:GATA zinc finger domain-containing protein 14-like [Microplitis mediator]